MNEHILSVYLVCSLLLRYIYCIQQMLVRAKLFNRLTLKFLNHRVTDRSELKSVYYCVILFKTEADAPLIIASATQTSRHKTTGV